MTGPEWEQRITDSWASFDEWDEAEFVAMMTKLCGSAPPECFAAARFELGGAYDSTGQPESAVTLYREALAAGLENSRRRRAIIQLASSLRNLGHLDESLALLTEELQIGSGSLHAELRAFLALALVDSGRGREAVAHALTALAPHLSRYQRSVANYARMLISVDEEEAQTS